MARFRSRVPRGRDAERSSLRILYVNALFPTLGDRRATGGAETFAVRLVQGLVAKGHAVSVVRSGASLTSSVEHTDDGTAIYSMPYRNVYPVVDGRKHNPASRLAWHLLEDRGRAAPDFERVVHSVQPDLVHSNNVVGMTADIWRVARAAGVPIVHTLHDYYLTCPKVLRYSGAGPCAQTCRSCSILSQKRRRAAANVDIVIGVSQRMLDIHRAEGLFVQTPSEVILNMPPPREGRALRARPLAARPTFGFIGRQAAEKGIYELLAAFCALGAGAAKLLIAGTVEPDVGRWVKRNAPCAGDITFTGYTTPEAFFPAIDVAVFPSIWEEPCSMGVGEALSYGVPVLGSRRGGTPELLQGGRFGWLVQPGTGELAAMLATLVADPAAIAAKAGIVQQIKPPSTDPLVTAYLDVYRRTRQHQNADLVGA